mmetsp:Transcript_24228/g.60929  ORF Transcript_24228/g.60929 Transcript_24228/m.60929 type:complete len:211 (+) Transcript_24228:7402-8034(+)
MQTEPAHHGAGFEFDSLGLSGHMCTRALCVLCVSKVHILEKAPKDIVLCFDYFALSFFDCIRFHSHDMDLSRDARSPCTVLGLCCWFLWSSLCVDTEAQEPVPCTCSVSGGAEDTMRDFYPSCIAAHSLCSCQASCRKRGAESFGTSRAQYSLSAEQYCITCCWNICDRHCSHRCISWAFGREQHFCRDIQFNSCVRCCEFGGQGCEQNR